jgi:trans-2,3-dihydro-3-hydroxyanthranilate isomerase
VPTDTDILAAFDPFDGSPGERRAGARRYVLADVFTDTPLEGNGLGVFTDGRGLTAEQMQRIARELNLSETVFVLPAERGGDARVRIFTPAEELPFAGHPVLGTAIVIGTALGRDAVTLETATGAVPLELTRRAGRVVSGRMRQPLPSWSTYEHEPALLRALGVGRIGPPLEVYDNGPTYVYVDLGSERALAELAPDMRALAELAPTCASCFAGSGRGWKMRMFAPGAGIPEDPATGSAAGPLAVHLSRHGRIAFGEQIEIRQGAEIGRPSLLYACARGSAERLERVEVAGSAVIVASGRFSAG